jgi:MFS transporter, PAT family, beta-lactamase induction signal transducer AmpG
LVVVNGMNRSGVERKDERRPPTGLWVSTTYFAEGLPYTIVRLLSTVYFTDVGAKERYLGYLNFLGIPWNFKFLWSPFVDAFATKRRWLVVLQFAIAISTFIIAALCALAASAGTVDAPGSYFIAIAVIFCVMAFLASTNDIAIDGYYLEGITDKREQAAYTGHRVTAFRVAMIYGRSGLVALAAGAAAFFAIQDPGLPWAYAFAVAAVTMLAFAAYHAVKLPRFEDDTPKARERVIKSALGLYGRAFKSYLDQDKVALVLLFLLVYKLGDDVLFAMVTPFLRRELKVSVAQYAWIAGLVGAFGSSLGAIAGAWWIKKRGLRRAIWPLTILMNFNIWAYCWLAWVRPDPSDLWGVGRIAFVHGYEQLAAGLGNAALMVYLLRTTKPDFKAAHFAIGSALMSIGSSVVGGFSGWLVEQFGYLQLFVGSFFLTLPSMILLFFVPLKDEETPSA